MQHTKTAVHSLSMHHQPCTSLTLLDELQQKEAQRLSVSFATCK
jgi:hypothetical protein